MARVRSVGVKELKNRLSEYLHEVRRGTRVLVTDRGTVVAELREPGPDAPGDARHPRAAEWIEAGLLAPPRRPTSPLPASPVALPSGTRPTSPLPASPVALPSGTGLAILDGLRGEGPR
jgi:antitoxin (DNA-binding transcriptional repressor) of toxin-antitoxin stability system